MTDDERILADLERWTSDRLRQVISDAMDRFEAVGVSGDDSVPYILAPLMTTMATALSMLPVPPEECGRVLTAMVRDMRQKERRRSQ